jgi:general secretion pathway protein G
MRKSPRRPSAFTLIELMMVVAIISILTSVVIPKFGNMVIKARESSVKGSLGALRGALSIYYSDTEGFLPSTGNLDAALSAGGRYLDAIPQCRIPSPGDHPATSGVTDFAGAYTDVGDWMYFASTGAITANCTHPDSIGRVWHTN